MNNLINVPRHNQAELLREATRREKRIERDTVNPARVFEPRHKKQSTLNIRELI